MREMIKRVDGEIKTTIKVVEHIILRNFWEYYVLDAETNEGSVKLCLVMGVEQELGDVDMNEIKPYVITKTKNLEEVAPASGWDWLK